LEGLKPIYPKKKKKTCMWSKFQERKGKPKYIEKERKNKTTKENYVGEGKVLRVLFVRKERKEAKSDLNHSGEEGGGRGSSDCEGKMSRR